MRRTALVLSDQRGDVFGRYVSRAKMGKNFGGGMPSQGDHVRFTPQMNMRGSPYPKFPGAWGIPSGLQAKVPERQPRDWDVMKMVQIGDLTPVDEKAKETRLPGVLWKSELPQDPVDRLFYQVKSSNAELLYTDGIPDNPDRHHEVAVDTDNGEFYNRDPLSLLCRALTKQDERRERFITVLATDETRQIARHLLDLGFIAGLRDYNNNWKFSIETKWWDNLPAVETMTRMSLQEKGVNWIWDVDEVAKVMYFNKVYNVVRIYFLKLEDGEIITHPEAFRRRVGGQPLCYVN
eukprot:TRINITY_DN1194_c0_g1_i1.p1 TRINITY_DN1194_c0_g1~~TRINITY_DN1194_c0_g1_i1.p1  ORF type:complete len:292 (+),score=40.22 TRINITY_DN1194_c0_g1_i1:68-943(+)